MKKPARKPKKPLGVEIGVASVRPYTPEQSVSEAYQVTLHCGYESSPSFNAKEARRLAAFLLRFADWAEARDK